MIDGNPLDDMEIVLKAVALVMKDGTIVRNDLGGRNDVDHHRVAQTVTA